MSDSINDDVKKNPTSIAFLHWVLKVTLIFIRNPCLSQIFPSHVEQNRKTRANTFPLSWGDLSQCVSIHLWRDILSFFLFNIYIFGIGGTVMDSDEKNRTLGIDVMENRAKVEL